MPTDVSSGWTFIVYSYSLVPYTNYWKFRSWKVRSSHEKVSPYRLPTANRAVKNSPWLVFVLYMGLWDPFQMALKEGVIRSPRIQVLGWSSKYILKLTPEVGIPTWTNRVAWNIEGWDLLQNHPTKWACFVNQKAIIFGCVIYFLLMWWPPTDPWISGGFFLRHDHAGRFRDRQESFQTWHGDYRDLVTWYQVAGLLGSQVG